MTDLLFSIDNITNLLKQVKEELHKLGYDGKTNIEINVKWNDLIKIDEELYYKQNPEGKDFIPSKDELNIKYENIDLTIKKTAI